MLKVLLVDDEPFILQGLSVLIDWNLFGFEISGTAANGKEALFFLKQNKVDLIISDIKMPEMTGLELLEAVRKQKLSDAYFIILSGYADFSFAQQAIKYDCSDYILKPVDKKELTEVLEKIASHEKEKSKNEIPPSGAFGTNTGNFFEDSGERSKVVLCKEELDLLITAINVDNHMRIKNCVESLFSKLQSIGLSEMSVNLNINYLLFHLVHLASEQNDELDQEEILRYISESSFNDGIRRGSPSQVHHFACEYADYLMQLHKQVPNNTLQKVLQEIHSNYSQNLTLKEFGEKYCLNSAYLGQLFKKQYNKSFKDYLNEYRLLKAEELLLKTDKKVYEIASEVGYHDPDYFVNLFINSKGCTPARFRRQEQNI